MAGWILLHRKITESLIWNDKPFSKGQAWIDLLLLANHKDNDILLGNEVVTIKRGQLHTSELKLAQKWGWSRNKVRTYLKLLEGQKMSTTVGTAKGTTITIENYSIYQDLSTTYDTAIGTMKKQRKNNEKTSKGTQTNNDKECKKNVKNIDTPYPLEEFSFSVELESKILEWLTYKIEKKDTYQPTGFKSLLGTIKKNTEQYGDEAVINLINECMGSNWKGIVWDKISKQNNELKKKEVVNANNDTGIIYDYDKFFNSSKE